MDLTRRFVFRGNASAIAGQIFRPKTIIVDVKGASSLGVSGGRSESQIAGNSFGDIIRFGSGYTLAEGLFDDEKHAAAVTDHKGRQSELSSTTTVTAETREVSVGLKTVVTHQARAWHAGEPFAVGGKRRAVDRSGSRHDDSRRVDRRQRADRELEHRALPEVRHTLQSADSGGRSQGLRAAAAANSSSVRPLKGNTLRVVQA